MIRCVPKRSIEPAEARRAERDEQAGRQERQRGLDRRPAVASSAGTACRRTGSRSSCRTASSRRGSRARAGPSAGCRAARAAGACAARSSRTAPAARRRSRTRRSSRASAQPVFGRLDDGAHEQQHRRRDRHRARDVVACARPRTGRSRGITRGATSRIASANGTGSRKVQRQPSSVSRPPMTSPSEKPARAGGGVDGQRAVAVRALAERGGDDREAGGRGERRAHALEKRVRTSSVPSLTSPPIAEATTNTDEPERSAPVCGRACRRRGRRAAAGRRSRARSPTRPTAAARW